MGLDALLTAVVIALALALVALEIQAPDLILLAAMLALSLLGVLGPQEVLAGFASPSLFAVGALLVLAQGLVKTGALDAWSLGKTDGERTLALRLITWVGAPLGRVRRPLLRVLVLGLALPVALGDVGTVAALQPRVMRVARTLGLAPSRYLLPLAYAASLGGALTVVGAVTNLMVSGLMVSRGMPPLSMWSLTQAALPAAAVGAAALVLLAPRLLPERAGLLEAEEARQREYLVEMKLLPTSPLVGRTIAQAGMRNLPGLFLSHLRRGPRTIAPVGPGERLAAEDKLIFAGSVDTIKDLKRFPGLVPRGEAGEPSGEVALSEAVVSDASPLVGLSVKGAGFRGRYGAAVVAVHRHGERLQGRLGDVVLAPGDTLLLQAAPSFARTFRDSTDFFVVSEVEESGAIRHALGWRARMIWLGVFVALALGVVPTVTAAVAGAVLVVATRCLTVGESRRAVTPSLLMMFAMGFPIALALEKTGLAAAAGGALAQVAAPAGAAGGLALCFVLTAALTQGIHNAVAAAIMLPVALQVAGGVGGDPRSFAVAVAVAAAFAFVSPRAYQTLRLVEGPGQYEGRDFLRLGLPLLLLTSAASLLALILGVGP